MTTEYRDGFLSEIEQIASAAAKGSPRVKVVSFGNLVLLRTGMKERLMQSHLTRQEFDEVITKAFNAQSAILSFFP